jgi:peptide/nickel transport system permease protein
MGRFVIARLLASIVLFFAITLFVFIVFFVMPQPRVKGPGRGGNADDLDIRDSIHLSGTMIHQYEQFVYGFVRHGYVGRSYANRQEVRSIIFRAAPVTLSLVLGGVIFWLLLSIPIGVMSALRPRSLLDRAGMLFVLIGVSAHPAWLGLILGYLLGYKLQIFPFSGYCEFFTPTTVCGGPTQWVYHLLLPWFVFALLYAAMYARMIRASTMETLDLEFVRTARAKGASEFKVVRSHVLRHAMLPIVTMIGMDIGTALGGVIFIESVFSLPGLGGTLRGAIPGRDLPLILGVVMFTTVAILVLNLIVDLAYAVIDPRIRQTYTLKPGLRTRRSAGGPAGAPSPAPAAPSA